ncbi:hypothetical protein HKBW3S47_02486, partial [Candidatus Hakubella thermalkaliphila]
EGKLIGIIMLGSTTGVNQFSRLIKEGVNCLHFGSDLLEEGFNLQSVLPV